MVVDITPAELRQRLEEGKVYVPETARPRHRHFFKPENLTALRELALRRTADRGRRPDGRLSCAGTPSKGRGRPPSASWSASAPNACRKSWCAPPAVSPTGSTRPGPSSTSAATIDEREPVESACIDATLRLAERLGAETAALVAADVAAEVLRYRPARKHHPDRARPLDLRLVAAPARQIAQRGHDAASGGHWRAHHRRSPDEPEPKPLLRWPKPELGRPRIRPVASVACAVLVGLGLSDARQAAQSVDAVHDGRAALRDQFRRLVAVAAAALSFFAYNFFFIEPLYTLHRRRAARTLGAAGLPDRRRRRRRPRRAGARRRPNRARRSASTQALYEFSRKLSGAAKLDDVLWASASQCAPR